MIHGSDYYLSTRGGRDTYSEAKEQIASSTGVWDFELIEEMYRVVEAREKAIKRFEEEESNDEVLEFLVADTRFLIGTENATITNDEGEKFGTSFDALYLLLESGVSDEDVKTAIKLELPFVASGKLLSVFCEVAQLIEAQKIAEAKMLRADYF